MISHDGLGTLGRVEVSDPSCHLSDVPVVALEFGEEYRPVKLEKFCFGYPQTTDENNFQFDLKLNNV